MDTYSPESVGMSSERLERIAPVMEAFVKDNQLPGIMTLVQRRGQVVHFGQSGLMDIEAGKPMQEDALFRIYSMTKPIISVALLMLLERGLFSLSDPVSKFIPAFKQTKVYAGSSKLGLTLVDQAPEMTLYHLMTHTAGLSYGWFFDSPVEDLYRQLLPTISGRSQLLSDKVEQLATLPLLYQPGTQWRYSMATDVVGLVIQIVTGKPLAEALEEMIFKPLGMVDTGFTVPPEKEFRLMEIYTSPALYDPVVASPERTGIGDVTTPTSSPSGGGGLVSTLADYLAFCNCLINEGRYESGRLLSRKTLAWMTTDHIPASLQPISIGPDMLDHGFGLGVRARATLSGTRALSSVGEYGWSGAAQTFFWIDPSESFIGLLMTQHLPTLPYPVHDRFRNLAYQAIDD